MDVVPSIVFAALLLAFPKYGFWDPPRPVPAIHPSAPGFGPTASDVGRTVAKARIDIDRARHSGQLSHHQAKELRRQAAYIDSLANRYAQDGLTDSELNELNSRANALESLIYVETSPLTPK